MAAAQRLCVTVTRGLAVAAALVLTPLPAYADCPPQAEPPNPARLQAGQRAAQDRGPQWRLEKDGREGWLYGTLHVRRSAWAFPDPQLALALQAADTVALEFDLGDSLVLASMTRGQALLRQREAAQPVPAALRARLTALAGAACVDSPPFRALPAVLQASALAVLSARRDGLDPVFGQVAMLAGLARASGKPPVALESAPKAAALRHPPLRGGGETLEAARRLLLKRRGPTGPARAREPCRAGAAAAPDRRAARIGPGPWSSWPICGPRATSTRWRSTRFGAAALSPRTTWPICGASTTAATRRWPTPSRPCMPAGDGCWQRWARCT